MKTSELIKDLIDMMAKTGKDLPVVFRDYSSNKGDVCSVDLVCGIYDEVSETVIEIGLDSRKTLLRHD